MQRKRSFGTLAVAGTVMLLLSFAVGCASTRRGIREDIDDASLTANVKARLAADPDVDAHQIDVDSDDGVVTLRGKVDSDFEKREATSVAVDTHGVRSVHNQLEVGESMMSKAFSDAWITSKIKSQLLADPTVRGLDIDVDTQDGNVTLSGKASTPQAILQAEALARNTDGVKEVDNQIELREQRGALESESPEEGAEWQK